MRPSEAIDAFKPAEGPPPQELRPFIGWALQGSGPALVAGSAVSIAAGVAEITGAVILGWVIDAALAAGPDQILGSPAIYVFAVLFFLGLRPVLFGLNAMFQNIVVAPNLMAMALQRLHRYTLGQPVTFFDNDYAGRISQKEMQTARALTDAVVEVLQTVFFALASVVGAIVLLGAVDWRISLVVAVWMVAYLALIRYFMPRIRKRSKARAASRANVTGQVVDTITNIKSVKLFAHADHEDRAALRAMADLRERTLDYGYVSVAFRTMLITLAGFLPLILVGGALWYWSLGLVSAGDIAATGAVSLRLAQMTGWVSFTLMTLYANIGEVEDGIRTLTPPHALIDAPDARALEITKPEIRFEDVRFAYGRQSGGVEHIDLTVHAGEKIGIVGASGAGKSTMVSLLLRLYDVEEGRVLVSGEDVRDVTQESLRRSIATVTQETAMFNRSARENILYGRPDASEGDLIDAARRAEALDFISDLKDFQGREGFEAHLGERGVKLSGGQRQRIALARAILKGAPILILDEATSALDSEVEASIQAALERVMEGKTVLAIAHRLSTIARMDRIIVLDEGHIREIGTHRELLQKNGLYARYWERQSGGFLRFDEAAE
ncbi:MAG: ABC transporter ATP-binding protein [Pseudomonadota bacterium]